MQSPPLSRSVAVHQLFLPQSEDTKANQHYLLTLQWDLGFFQCCRSASERIFELKRKVFHSFALISYCWERKKLFSPLQSLSCRCNVKEVVWIFWYRLGGAAEIKSQCVFNCWLQFHLFCECMASELLSWSRFIHSIECLLQSGVVGNGNIFHTAAE